MFSGKTEELIRRLNRLMYANVDFILFKPKIDDRYDELKVVSHNGRHIKAIPIQYAEEITTALASHYCGVIAIDEVQFLNCSVVDICKNFDGNTRIILAGLDMDYTGKPFPVMKELLPIADKVDKLSAVCLKCGENAKMSYKIATDNLNIVDVGGKDKYEARCKACWHL